MSRKGGFTLLEVVLALAILAMAVVYLLAIRNEAIETASDAIAIRRLQMLADWKMDQILSGQEEATSGGFDDEDLEGDYRDYRWSVEKTPITVRGERQEAGSSGGGSGTVDAFKVKLTVEDTNEPREVVLVGYLYEEEKREEKKDESGSDSSGGGDSEKEE